MVLSISARSSCQSLELNANSDFPLEIVIHSPSAKTLRDSYQVLLGRGPRTEPSPTPHASTVTGLSLKPSSVMLREMKLLERITVEPDKCGGRPCIRGMRIRVTDILGMLAEGVPHDEILRDFPYLEPDDIKAALAYAARQADHAVLQSA